MSETAISPTRFSPSLNTTRDTEWILIDCDDVMADFASFICNEMNKIGKQAEKSDYLEYRFMDYHELTHAQFLEAVKSSNAFLKVKPFDGVKEALRVIKAKGFNIAIVTARGMFENSKKNTQKWLSQNELIYDRLYVIDPRKTNKSAVFSKFEGDKIRGLVDDATHNLVDAMDNNVLAIRIEQPWNVKSPYDYSAPTLLEIAHQL